MTGFPIHNEDVVRHHVWVAVVVFACLVVGVDRVTAGLPKGIIVQAESFRMKDDELPAACQ